MHAKAEVFKLLGNEVRLSIVMAIHSQGGLRINVSEIQAITGYPQATVSQHLSKLRATKLVKTQREGTKIYYKISDPVVNQVLSSVQK